VKTLTGDSVVGCGEIPLSRPPTAESKLT